MPIWDLGGQGSGLLGFGGMGKLGKGPARSSEYDTVDPGGLLAGMSGQAGGAAAQGDAGYGRMTGELNGDRRFLQEQRSGQHSLAAEQLRQGLEQQQGQLAGMAAGARPGQQPMAARTAMMSMGRAGSAMAGNAQMARIAEQNAAAQTLAGLNLQQRGQDINYSTGQRGLGIQGYGTLENSRTQRYGADMGAPSQAEVILGGLSGLARAGATGQ